MTTDKVLVWGCVDRNIKEMAQRLAKIQGISLSEYIRQLIIADLEKRNFITTKFKEVIKE